MTTTTIAPEKIEEWKKLAELVKRLRDEAREHCQGDHAAGMTYTLESYASWQAAAALEATMKAPAPDAGMREATKPAIYIASKTAHAERWRFLRDKVGEPIISSWIDEAGEGQTADWSDLWNHCLNEAASAAVTIAYHEGDEVMKGALVEVGAALSHGRHVIVVGEPQGTWVRYADVIRVDTMKEAIAKSRELLRALASAPQPAASEAAGKAEPDYEKMSLQDSERALHDLWKELGAVGQADACAKIEALRHPPSDEAQRLRAQVIEECAKVADAVAEKASEEWSNATEDGCGTSYMGAQDTARAIRALASAPAEEKGGG